MLHNVLSRGGWGCSVARVACWVLPEMASMQGTISAAVRYVPGQYRRLAAISRGRRSPSHVYSRIYKWRVPGAGRPPFPVSRCISLSAMAEADLMSAVVSPSHFADIEASALFDDPMLDGFWQLPGAEESYQLVQGSWEPCAYFMLDSMILERLLSPLRRQPGCSPEVYKSCHGFLVLPRSFRTLVHRGLSSGCVNE